MSYSTYAEYLDTDEFREVCAELRIRSGGMCERGCGRKATEPHHVKYCRWGDFDVVENLLDLCHLCHCDAHRCSVCGEVKLKARHIKRATIVCDDCKSKDSASADGGPVRR